MAASHKTLTAAGLLAVLLTARGVALGAESPAKEPSAGELAPVVVVGDRYPTDPFSSDRMTGAIDETGLLEAAVRTTPEALHDMTGVFVQQTNPGGGSPIIRGLVGPQNLIVVDGVRFNNSLHRTGPTQYLNLVDALSLDRIEVLRGPGSVLYGSDAMGGVIALYPLALGDGRGSGELRQSGRALARYGSAARQRTMHVDVRSSGGGFGAVAGMTYQGFDDVLAGRGAGRQPHTSYDQWSALARSAYRFPYSSAFEDWQASLTYMMTRLIDAERSDKWATAGSVMVYDNADDLVYGRLEGDVRPLATRLSVTGSIHHFAERVDVVGYDDARQHEVTRSRDEVRAITMGWDLQLDTRVLRDRLVLRYGGTYYRDWVMAEDGERRSAGGDWEPTGVATYPDGATYDLYGAFLHIEGVPVHTDDDQMLRLAAGYRFHGVRGHAPARGALAARSFSHQGHVLSGSLSYLFADRFTAAFTFSQGFRAPNLNETVMLGETGQWFHAPAGGDLGPERSDTFELLFRGRIGPLSLSASGYVSVLSDLIKRERTTWEGQEEVGGRPVVRNANGSGGLLTGCEAELRLAVGGGFSVWGNLAYTWGEEYVEDGSDVPLSRVPPLFGQAGVRYDVALAGGASLFFETFVRAAGDQDRLSPRDEDDDRIADGGTPGWWTWNVRAGSLFLDHFRLMLVVDNLLDKAYRYHGSGVMSAGTNVVVTLESSF